MDPYIEIDDADDYFAERLYVQDWTSATDANKDIALIEATKLIDRLQFRGSKVDEDQVLEFPRYTGEEPDGDETVPDDIKYACCEIALALLGGYDLEKEAKNLGVIRRTFDRVTTVYKDSDTAEHLVNGIPSARAWSYLKLYLAYSKSIRVHRTT
jgi:hypothetical protein